MNDYSYNSNRDQIIRFIRKHKEHLVLEDYFPCFNGNEDCAPGEWFFKQAPGVLKERYIMLSKADITHVSAINADTGEIDIISIYDIAPAKINILDHADQVIDGLSRELEKQVEPSLYSEALKCAMETLKEEMQMNLEKVIIQRKGKSR